MIGHTTSQYRIVEKVGGDGKKFAVSRARYNDADVVMFSGLR